jgi:hypothetical protein
MKTEIIEIRQSRESGRFPDHVDDMGFPWWDEAPTPSPEPQSCRTCGSDLWNGWCAYAGADHS